MPLLFWQFEENQMEEVTNPQQARTILKRSCYGRIAFLLVIVTENMKGEPVQPQFHRIFSLAASPFLDALRPSLPWLVPGLSPEMRRSEEILRAVIGCSACLEVNTASADSSYARLERVWQFHNNTLLETYSSYLDLKKMREQKIRADLQLISAVEGT